MERKINVYLNRWKRDVSKKVLVIYGNKQVGKTYSVLKFGEKEYKNEYHFENQIKTKEKIYLSNNKYFENVFFEDDIKIYSEYEDGKKILEITYYQEKEIRRKENR